MRIYILIIVSIIDNKLFLLDRNFNQFDLDSHSRIIIKENLLIQI